MHRTILLVYAVTAGLSHIALAIQTPDDASANGPPTITAYRLVDGETIDLNGWPDEPFWYQGTGATEFRQSDPNEGAEPTERTEVYIVYSATDLYIGAWFHDSDPSGILAYQKERDAFLSTDDRFMWILDTFLNGRTGYFFEINPAGMMGDALLSGGGGGGGGGHGGSSRAWDGIWEARTARGPTGWSAEIRIPFRTLNFDPNSDTWGINFQRTVRRKNEEILWSGHRRNQGLRRPVHAGRLQGLEDLSQGLGLEVLPYVTSGWQREPDNGIDAVKTEVGLDVQYSLTSSLRAAVTVNTDFAEVEVDQRRVNLTRFPLRFPERRDFFLEGSGVYSFSPRNGVEPFFSRQIGLNEGAPVPITYGLRLGGQAGPYELGFQQIHTRSDRRIDDEGVPFEVGSEDFTIARVKRTIFEQSSLGAIYTRRASSSTPDAASPPDRHTLGIDLDFFTSRFLGDKNFQFEAFLVAHTDPVAGGTSSFGDLSSRGIRINYPNDFLQAHVSYRELGEEFDPAVGFTRRNGFRRLQPTVSIEPRPSGISWIRQFEFEIMFEHLTNLENELETRQLQLQLLGVDFESGDNLNFRVTQQFERLDDPFEISDGVIIPQGGFNTLGWQFQGRTASRRKVSGSLTIEGGEFWSGTRTRIDASISFRPVAGFTITTQGQRNDVSLPEGQFTTNLLRLTGGWQLSPWVSARSNLQYDDVSRVVGLFTRFRWIVRPGNDFFFVYTQNWENMGSRLLDFDYRTLSQGVATKVGLTQRF